MYDYENYTNKEIIDTTATNPQLSKVTNEMSYNPYEELVLPSKKKKRTGLKVIGLLCCFTLVAAGSIQVYKFLDDGGLGYQDTGISVTQTSTSEKAEKKEEDDKGLTQGIVDSIKTNEPDTITAQTLDDYDKTLHLTAAAREGALSVPEIYSKVIPSVVGIRSTFSVGTATGTGIIMSTDGYVVTNAHVVLYSYNEGYSFLGGGQTVEEPATEVTVLLSDENQTEYEAIVIGYDSESDLAVLKINETGLTAAEFGDSDALLVGEDVVAIGNPLGFDLFGTLTKGVVSALNRDVTINDNSMTLIQTDTAINSGNSGGPLINCYGQVIGINSAKLSSSYTSSGASVEGLAFAIPITDAKKIIDDLTRYGYVTGKPILGITCRTVSDTYGSIYGEPVEGALVTSITARGASDKAGLQIGDIITALNDTKISTAEDLTAAKDKYTAGDTVTLHIIRDSEDMEINVTLAEKAAPTFQ